MKNNTPSPELNKKNILVVDDTPANLRLLTKMLSDRGYQVRPVIDGQLGLAAVKAQAPDLILLDVRMPGMNGYEFCEHLKADPDTQDIPIIFISAMDALEDKIKAFTAGGVDYVSKPFQIEEVLARVETHLTISQLREQLQSANQKMSQELHLAGEIQRSFMQLEQPTIDGWDLAARLIPAKETSGDFYDLHLRPDKKVDIIVADVVDKGVSAALFMALSWITFHTYAEQYPGQPERVLEAVNRQILKYARSSQFITIFNSVLNPAEGKLTYSNGGHPPPLLFRGGTHQFVEVPGVRNAPLGLMADSTWAQGTLDIEPGDVVVLYTDGIIEAQNAAGDFYGDQGLIDAVSKHLGTPAEQMAEAILNELQLFMGEKSFADDITLVVVICK